MLTRDAAIPLLHSVLVAPATHTVRGIATEVHLDPSDGVPQECALTLDNLTLISKALLTRQITTLDAMRMEQVCRALRFAVECE